MNYWIKGNLITLRKLGRWDKEDLFRNIFHDREVLTYYIARYRETLEEFDFDALLDYYSESNLLIYAIVRNDTGETIGMINECNHPTSFSAGVELGYAIGKAHWNQGFMTEALSMMIEICFTRGVHKVTAGAITENEASIRVMQKAGMLYEGIRKDEVYYNDRYYDEVVYYLINES